MRVEIPFSQPRKLLISRNVSFLEKRKMFVIFDSPGLKTANPVKHTKNRNVLLRSIA